MIRRCHALDPGMPVISSTSLGVPPQPSCFGRSDHRRCAAAPTIPHPTPARRAWPRCPRIRRAGRESGAAWRPGNGLRGRRNRRGSGTHCANARGRQRPCLYCTLFTHGRDQSPCSEPWLEGPPITGGGARCDREGPVRGVAGAYVAAAAEVGTDALASDGAPCALCYGTEAGGWAERSRAAWW